MPTYGYQCKACGHEFEVFQKITDAALSACEKCGGALKKLLYPVGIQFKGSGFYVNDYGRSSAPKEGKDGAKTASDTATETTKTESKPAASGSAA